MKKVADQEGEADEENQPVVEVTDEAVASDNATRLLMHRLLVLQYVSCTLCAEQTVNFWHSNVKNKTVDVFGTQCRMWIWAYAT